MAQAKYYKVSTIPRSQQKVNFFSRKRRSGRRRNLAFSVLGVYGVIAMVIFGVLSGNSGNPAKADEAAYISASLRIEEKDYKVGDKVKVDLTLQNTSSAEAINNSVINFYSTRESVRWEKMQNANNPLDVLNPEKPNNFKLPILASGERAEFQAEGILQNDQFDYLNILAKINFLNKEGTHEMETNRVYTKLKYQENLADQKLTLKSDKTIYAQKEEVKITLERITDAKLTGKIYLTNRDTQESKNTYDCKLEDNNTCDVSLKNLEPANYSILFISQDEKFYSNILWFNTQGTKSDFKPSSQAVIDLPFASTSINGLVPIIARRVISLNQQPDSTQKCQFDIMSDKQVLSTVEASLENDRTCHTTLNSESFKKGAGTYTIQLKNSPAQKDLVYNTKSQNLLNLDKKSTILDKTQNLEVQADNIKDAQNQALDGKKVTLGIWHSASGDYQEYTNFNGEPLKVTGGTFKASIPNIYLKQGGFYQIYIKIEDGQFSDFLGVNFEDKNIDFAGSGVLYNDSGLKVTNNLNFSLEGVTDRNGNLVDNADCAAEIYPTGSGASPISIKGQIKKGVCSSVLPTGKVTKSGPALITFTGQSISNKINQSRQIYFTAGDPQNYGQLSFGYEPVRQNYANNVIIGPVTDKYGNLVDAHNYHLAILDKDKLVHDIPELNITNGFASVSIPSSFLSLNKLTFKFLNDQNQELLAKNIDLKETEEKLVLPNIPDKLNSNDNLKVTLKGLLVSANNDCKTTFYKSQTEFLEEVAKFDNQTNQCNFDWNISKFRDNSQALVVVTAGNYTFSQVVKLENADPASLFTLSPQIRNNENNELEISLFTSPIIDKQGQPVKSGKVSWEYNGKTAETSINNGLSELKLLASSLQPKDLKSDGTSRNLDLDLNVKASNLSFSKTNNLVVYLGNKDISNKPVDFSPVSTVNQILVDTNKILQFKTSVCNARILNNNQTSTLARTHIQGGICFVEVTGSKGYSSIIFEQKGFTIGKFDYTTSEAPTDINWCLSEQTKCLIQVLAPVSSPIEAIIYDGDKEYKFKGQDLENTVEISQNGLNPLKQYPVQVHYTNQDGYQVAYNKLIQGNQLSK